MLQSDKNKMISDAKKATLARRKYQNCKTFKFKVDQNALKPDQKESLKMFFVEAKWVYNYLLSHQDNIFDVKTKYKELSKITHLDKDKKEVEVEITHIGSSVKQELIQQIGNQIKGLSTLKKHGYKVGHLKFKSGINSIPLKQYSITHEIKGNKIRIQGIKRHIRVTGLNQLKKYQNIDYTTAKLLYDGYNYWITLTCYIDKENKTPQYKNDILGLDFGCETSITCSDGKKVKVSIGESERLKKLQAQLARKKKYSNNWYKTRSLIKKEYAHISNKKNDITNKIVHALLSENTIIVMQDEQLSEWHKIKYDMDSDGKKHKKHTQTSSTVQHSVLGRLKSKLIECDRVIVLDRWFPTTKYCPACGAKTEIPLDQRTFVCSNCGMAEDRDIHAATNMIFFYQKYKDEAGTAYTSKPERKIKFSDSFLTKQENTASLTLC